MASTKPRNGALPSDTHLTPSPRLEAAPTPVTPVPCPFLPVSPVPVSVLVLAPVPPNHASTDSPRVESSFLLLLSLPRPPSGVHM